MITSTEYDCMTQHLNGPLLDFYLHYLEIEDNKQLRFDYEIFLEDGIELEDPEEVWRLPCPALFTSDLLMADVSTPGFAIGRVEFGRYNGRKIIIEQNASPLMVYWKAS